MIHNTSQKLLNKKSLSEELRSTLEQLKDRAVSLKTTADKFSRVKSGDIDLLTKIDCTLLTGNKILERLPKWVEDIKELTAPASALGFCK